ncbi:uncharacterized protein SCHCODRAFT_02495072, partial [Schizophyllum commune H4-8]|uniref:uncharacterized protein n=1 Tax=Schizophyllum commune (strain H4-8 / FGSC 9210) TaxID=578458 RepID=UPI002160F265
RHSSPFLSPLVQLARALRRAVYESALSVPSLHYWFVLSVALVWFHVVYMVSLGYFGFPNAG